ncbi:hypothetical protein Tco_1311949 [Tanacetum coccineum]
MYISNHNYVQINTHLKAYEPHAKKGLSGGSRHKGDMLTTAEEKTCCRGRAKEKGDVLDAELEAFPRVMMTAPHLMITSGTDHNKQCFQSNHEDPLMTPDVDEGPNAAVRFHGQHLSSS